MRRLLLGLVIAVGILPPASGLAQEPAQPAPQPPPRVLQLTFEPGGLVSLVASNVTIRDVLAEWTRKGGTTFPGAERLPGGTISLQFDHRPETEVVGSILRNASGYLLAPREADSSAMSQLAAVYVVATSNATAVSGAYSQPSYSQPQMSTSGNPDQEIAPVGPGRSGESPQQAPAPAPPPASRPTGVGPIAVQVVPVTPVTTPPPNGGRGGGRGSR